MESRARDRQRVCIVRMCVRYGCCWIIKLTVPLVRVLYANGPISTERFEADKKQCKRYVVFMSDRNVEPHM